MTSWGYAFEPADLADGLPPGVLAEVERVATELAELGPDAEQVGEPEGRSGGLRTLHLRDCPGFFLFLVGRPTQEIVIVQVTAL